jgi:hypothetical protein
LKSYPFLQEPVEQCGEIPILFFLSFYPHKKQVDFKKIDVAAVYELCQILERGSCNIIIVPYGEV